MSEDAKRFVYVTYIKTTPERLWQALTTPEFSRQYWWRREVSSDFAVGSPIRYHHDGGQLDIDGQILAADPPKLLSFTFTDPSARDRGERPSRVTFAIADADEFDGVVKLTVTHDDFPTGSPSHAGVSEGWPDILANLKTVLETGRPLPYKDTAA